jgi:hypothetical protein
MCMCVCIYVRMYMFVCVCVQWLSNCYAFCRYCFKCNGYSTYRQRRCKNDCRLLGMRSSTVWKRGNSVSEYYTPYIFRVLKKISLKPWQTFAKQHDITSRKTLFLIFTAFGVSNLIDNWRRPLILNKHSEWKDSGLFKDVLISYINLGKPQNIHSSTSVNEAEAWRRYILE